MEGFFKKSLCVAALVSALGIDASTTVSTGTSVPLITPRSLGTDGALRMSCDAIKQNLFGKEDDGFWGVLSLAGGAGRTFRSKRIAKCLFGPDISCDTGCPSINISGKCATDRGANDWLADYFGLPTDYKSTVTFKPRVTHAFVDFNAYVGLDSWWEGLYVTLRVPFEHARYRLGFDEDITNAGVNGYDQGYFSEAFVPRSNLLASFEDFVVNGKVPTLSGFTDSTLATAQTTKVVFDPLTCAKMYTCKDKDKNRVADLSASVGWNFFLDEDYHLGAFILASAPTGNRPHAEFLFEPMVGGGHRWNLGGGISGHYILWQSDDEESCFGFYLDGSVTHEFKSRQKRFFDLKGKANSRYMLAEKLGTPVTNLVSGTTTSTAPVPTTSTAPSAQFANEFTSVANLTCCDVNVSVDVQGQVVAMFNYTWKDFSWDLGYEFWGRSCDKITMNCECQCPLDAAPNTWALKGDASVYGFTSTTDEGRVPINTPIALSATDSTATIHQGDNVPVGTACSTGAVTTLTDTRVNPKIDNPQFAFTGITATDTQIMYQRGIADSATGIGQQHTSNAPVFLSSDDVDICGAQSKGMSHTVFTAVSYTWADWSDTWTPYVGIGGKAEFAQDFGGCESSCDDNGCSTSTTSTTNTTDCCDDNNGCQRCNFSQWAAWVKLGVAFN